MNPERAVAIIRDVGVFGLGFTDGCICTSFSIQGIDVDISCRKGSNMDTIFREFYGIGIRVYSSSLDSTGEGLGLVAREVARQLADQGYDIKVRLCNYDRDRECKCVWCGNPREKTAYLCDQCLTNEDAKPHDGSQWEFSVLRPAEEQEEGR